MPIMGQVSHGRPHCDITALRRKKDVLQVPRWSSKVTWAAYGAAFGLFFPVVAVTIRYLQEGFGGALVAVTTDQLLWIIATAPLFLGMFAGFGGHQNDVVRNFSSELERMVAVRTAALEVANGKLVQESRDRSALAESLARDKERLNASEQLLRDAQKLAKIGSWDLDVAKQHLVWSSESYRIFEVDEPQLGGALSQILRGRIHPEDLPAFNDMAALASQAGGVVDFPFRLLFADGRTKYLHCIGRASVTGPGAGIRLSGTVQDITDRKRSDFQLIQSSKMASLGEMAAGVAHEINNPLAIIIGTATLLRRVAHEPAKLEAKIEALTKASERIARIVRGLKKFSRVSEDRTFQERMLAEVVKEALVLTEAKARTFNTTVTSDFRTDGLIYCDTIEIEQVVINLVHNAIDAVKDGVERWVRVEILGDAGDLVLRVLDAGVGIPEAVQRKLFEPFFTTKKVGEGTGLGLSITKGILDEHNATITIVAASRNTCFEVRFKRAEVTLAA